MHKLWVKIVAGVIAVVVLVVVCIPFFINADTFRPQIESQLSVALGRKVQLGNLSFSLFTGSLKAQNISIADDPKFSSAPFLTAKELQIGVDMDDYVLHHKIRITKFVAVEPQIQLIQDQNGTWNFSTLGGTTGKRGSSSPSMMPDMYVKSLEIDGGRATVSSVPATSKPIVLSSIDFAVQNFSYGKSFPFQLAASVPGSGTIQLKGDAGPISQTDGMATPFKAVLECRHLDPVAAGLVPANDGISMVDDIHANVASDGTVLTSSGRLTATHLQLVRAGTPVDQPVDVDYSLSDNLVARTGKITQLSIHTGAVETTVTGTFKFTPAAVLLDLQLAAPNLPIDQVEQLLPAVGIRVPSGSSLKGGTLTANLAITGPATATDLKGPVALSNTQLAGFNLGSKIQGLNPFGGATTAGGTNIQTLRADVNSSQQATQISNIYVLVPGIGTATGGGTISPTGVLDFNMVATLSSQSAIGSIANGAMSAIAGIFNNDKKAAADHGIPLTITGTTTSPSITANMGALMKQETGGLMGNSGKSDSHKQSPAGLLKGIF
jgi:AsmA protein